jgi:hypothetical protein
MFDVWATNLSIKQAHMYFHRRLQRKNIFSAVCPIIIFQIQVRNSIQKNLNFNQITKTVVLVEEVRQKHWFRSHAVFGTN